MICRYFFEHPLDQASNYMAAFTAKDPTEKIAFMSHWQKILEDDRIIKKTILVNDQVADIFRVLNSSVDHFLYFLTM